MIPDEPEYEPQPFSPGFAVLVTLAGAGLQVFFVQLINSPSASVRGIASILGFGIAFALATVRIHTAPAATFGFRAPPARAWWVAALFIPSILLVSELDNMMRAVIPRPQSPPGTAQSLTAFSQLEFAIYVILVRPVVDELFFRGLLQQQLVIWLGAMRGIAAAAALSALSLLVTVNLIPLLVALQGVRGVPIDLGVIAYGFGLAVVMGLLRHYSGSVLPGIALGIAFGVSTVLASLQLLGIPGFDDVSAAHTPLGWLIPAALFTGVALRLCRSLPEPAPLPEAEPDPEPENF